MVNSSKQKQYYYWVDNTKCIACILVVLGHFWMSMVVSGISKENVIYDFTIQSIYTFHVPLFFVCSGFLYQKSNRVHTIKSWSKNVLYKLLNLGVPYFTFTLITFLMKAVFSNSVNNQNGNIIRTLFISPIAPYWFLYALFFLFLVTPCMKTKKQAEILLAVAFALKIANIVLSTNNVSMPSIIKYILGMLIWFAIGIFLAFDEIKLTSKICKVIMVISAVCAFAICIFYYRTPKTNEPVKFIVGLLFVTAIIIASYNFQNDKLNNFCNKFSKYFMPIYVMHTIFAAGIRIILLKLGITNIFIHTVLGLTLSFAVPIIIYKIAIKLPFIMFFISPKEAIKSKKTNHTAENSYGK